jgi:hypothetical protein
LAKSIGIAAAERNYGHNCHGQRNIACRKGLPAKRSEQWQNNFG